MDRTAMLRELLAQDPQNALARYGLAVEYSHTGELARALEEFEKLLMAHPDYVAGYFMAAQTLIKANQADRARAMLRDGIRVAGEKRDAHAQAEMQALLDDLR